MGSRNSRSSQHFPYHSYSMDLGCPTGGYRRINCWCPLLIVSVSVISQVLRLESEKYSNIRSWANHLELSMKNNPLHMPFNWNLNLSIYEMSSDVSYTDVSKTGMPLHGSATGDLWHNYWKVGLIFAVCHRCVTSCKYLPFSAMHERASQLPP